MSKISANKEVILCAGSIGSPHILQVSGIGDGDKLSKIGIDIIKNLKGVGFDSLAEEVAIL